MDTEKTMKGLKICSNIKNVHCEDCPYMGKFCAQNLANDALELIETQKKEFQLKMQPIVICNDCQFYVKNPGETWNICSLHSIKTYDNNYCWWGCSKSDNFHSA